MNAATAVLVVLLLIWTIVGRLQGRPLRQRRLLVIPGVLSVVGLAELGGVHLTMLAIVLMALQIVISIGVGALRGWTVHLYERDGFLWMRYRWTTLALWLLTIVIRVGFVAGAQITGAGTGGSQVLMVGLGLGLLGEGVMVAWRANALGIPYAPDDRARVRI